MIFERSVAMSNSQIRRRDEDGKSLLEGKATFEVDGQRHSCIRTVTIRQDGKHVCGEDALFFWGSGARVQVVGLQFDLGEGCSPVPSRDGESILIRTPARQAWRFRCTGFDIQINQFRVDLLSGMSQNRRHQLVCSFRANDASTDTIMRWDFQLEDLI
jgi:uncharacterized heparinase superfamily protein